MSSNRDLNLPITAEDFTGPATDSAAKNFDGLQKKVDGFSTKKPRQEVDDFGRLVTSKTKDGETGFQAVQRQIDETTVKITGLRKEVAGTGNVDLFGDLKGQEADLQKLLGFFDDMTGQARKKGKQGAQVYGDEFLESLPFGLGKVGQVIGRALGGAISDAAEVGEEAGASFALGLGSASEAAAEDIPQLFTPQGVIGAAVIAVIGGSLAAAAGGALATALTLGVGAGFIGIGALVEKNNVAVSSNFARLKSDIGHELEDAASPLVGSFDRAMEAIDRTVGGQHDNLSKIFTALAPAVDEITTGITHEIDDLTPKLVGVSKLFTKMLADPEIKEDLHSIGNLVGDLFSNITDHQAATQEFFHLLLFAIGYAVAGIDALELAWDGLVATMNAPDTLVWKIAEWVTGFKDTSKSADGSTKSVKAAAGAVGQLGEAASQTIQTWDDLQSALGKTTATMDTFSGAATDKAINTLLGLDHGTLGFQESLTSLSSALKTNKHDLDIHHAAGQADREAILGVVSANLQQYDSMIAAGYSAAQAAAQYDKNFKSLEHLPGLTKSQQSAVDKLVGSYSKVPDKIDTNVAMSGLADALNDLDDLLRQIYKIPKEVPVSISPHLSQSALDKALGQIRSAERAALSAGPSWSPTIAGYADASTPARIPEVTASIRSELILDGQVIDRRIHRVQAQERHAARVGRRVG